MCVRYEVWLIFLTSLKDCKLFHLRELIEFSWQISRQNKTPSTSRTRKTETLLKYAFILFCKNNAMHKMFSQENDLFLMFPENKEPITRK